MNWGSHIFTPLVYVLVDFDKYPCEEILGQILGQMYVIQEHVQLQMLYNYVRNIIMEMLEIHFLALTGLKIQSINIIRRKSWQFELDLNRVYKTCITLSYHQFKLVPIKINYE